MNYEQALAFIHGAFGQGHKRGQDNMVALLGRLGNPHRAWPSLHVAGTNGKGSVCSYIERALRAHGYRTGLYTSPYLTRFNERMRVDGRPIADEELAEMTRRVAREVEILRAEGVCPTEFEIGTAIAFTYFAHKHVDFGVIEVGLGGRLCPTSVITPEVCAIAAIGMDHTKQLGDTLECIAWEKAGIVKPGVPVVLHPQKQSVREVVAAVCEKRGAPLVDLSRANFGMMREEARGVSFTFDMEGMPAASIRLRMPGEHQAHNAATAYAALWALRGRGFKISGESIIEGLAATHWPGRLEWIGEKPAYLLDGAHNGQGAQALLQFARRHLRGRKTVLVFSALRDKPIEDVARALAGVAPRAVIAPLDSHRAAQPEQLAALLNANGVAAGIAPTLEDALAQGANLAGPEGVVVVSGSLYLVGAARALLLPLDDGTLP